MPLFAFASACAAGSADSLTLCAPLGSQCPPIPSAEPRQPPPSAAQPSQHPPPKHPEWPMERVHPATNQQATNGRMPELSEMHQSGNGPKKPTGGTGKKNKAPMGDNGEPDGKAKP